MDGWRCFCTHMGRVSELGRAVNVHTRSSYHASSSISGETILVSICCLPQFRCMEEPASASSLRERKRGMRIVQARMLVLPMLALLIMRPFPCSANFHVVNMYYGYYGDTGLDYQMVIPSTNWGCGGVQTDTIAGGKYPDCHGGYDLHLPNGTCGYSGVTIRPACQGRYFGILRDQNGGNIGDCYWHDAGGVSTFSCKLNVSNSDYQLVYDRLLCSTVMCGGSK